MNQLWSHVIHKALADLKHGGISDARAAYRFFFSPDCEEDLTAVCCFAGLNVEAVRSKAAKIQVPDKVRGISAAPKQPKMKVVAAPKEKPCLEPYQFGPKFLGEAGYSRLRYYRDVQAQRERKQKYYAANGEACRARSKAWKAAQKLKRAKVAA